MACAKQTPLPRRVNIVCGGKYALVKSDRWDCPAQVLAASEVLSSTSARRYHRNKWKIQADKSVDQLGRPLCCKIRNDCHPRRSLRGTTPVMVDNKAWTAEHYWLIQYVEGSEQNGSVSAAFHLCNLKAYPETAYLTVDEGTGELILQQTKPSMMWEFYDSAAAPTQSLPAMPLAQASTCETDVSPADADVLKPSAKPEHLAALFQQEDLAEKLLGFQTFRGQMERAFIPQQKTSDGKRVFTDLERMLEVGTPLGEEVEVCPQSCTIFGLAAALFGSGSSFRHQLTEGKDAEVSSIKALPEAAWCGVGNSRFRVRVPVLGERPFEEDMRIALAIADTTASLVVQVSSKVALGFPVGDFITEAVHVFTQTDGGGPVVLKSYGFAAPGRHQGKAIEGMRSSRQTLSDIVRGIAASTAAATLEVKPSKEAASDVEVAVDHKAVAPDSLADSEMCSTAASESDTCDARTLNEPWSVRGTLQNAFRQRTQCFGGISLSRGLNLASFQCVVCG